MRVGYKRLINFACFSIFNNSKNNQKNKHPLKYMMIKGML